jgi:hypothetical protein
MKQKCFEKSFSFFFVNVVVLICISNSISERYCKIMHFRENFFRTSLTLWKSVHFCNESIIPTIAWRGSQKMLKNNIVKIFLFFYVINIIKRINFIISFYLLVLTRTIWYLKIHKNDCSYESKHLSKQGAQNQSW